MPPSGGRRPVFGNNYFGATGVTVGGKPATDLHVRSGGLLLEFTAPALPPGYWHIQVRNAYFASTLNQHDEVLYPGPKTMGWPTSGVFDTFRGRQRSISCPTDDFCATVDHTHAFLFRGGTWHAPAELGSDLRAVSCASAQFCVAVDGAGRASPTTGRPGRAPRQLANAALASVSCPTASLCMALRTDGLALAYRNGTWAAPVSIGEGIGRTVSCATATFCGAVGGTNQAHIWTGSTWSTKTYDDVFQFNGISCPSNDFCVAADREGKVYTRDAAGWGNAGCGCSTRRARSRRSRAGPRRGVQR